MTLTHPRSTLSSPHFPTPSKAGTGAGTLFSSSSAALKADRMVVLAGAANLTRHTPISWLTPAPHQPERQHSSQPSDPTSQHHHMGLKGPNLSWGSRVAGRTAGGIFHLFLEDHKMNPEPEFGGPNVPVADDWNGKDPRRQEPPSNPEGPPHHAGDECSWASAKHVDILAAGAQKECPTYFYCT